jgi:hypothetical protein
MTRLNSSYQLETSFYYEHNIIVYDDVYTLREVYCRSAKNALEKNNEIMLIVTTYGTPNTVREMLREYEIDVKKYECDGALVIIDCEKNTSSPSALGGRIRLQPHLSA